MIRRWFATASRTTIGIVAAIVAVVLIAVPAAIWSGALSFLFATPQEGLRAFLLALGVGVVFVVGEVLADLERDRRKRKRQGSTSAGSRRNRSAR